MTTPLRLKFAGLVRETRVGLDVTQDELARAAHVTRGYVAMIEGGRANATLDVAFRLGDALGLDLQVVGRPPIIFDGGRQRDLVHARCSGYVDRRLRAAGLRVAREVEVVLGRAHGWIDLLAFDPRTRTLLVVELKTRLDDIGLIERQLGWYERHAISAGERLGWVVRRQVTWLVALASDEVDRTVRDNRVVLATTFAARAPAMLTSLGSGAWHPDRGLALVDPSSRRRDWLIRTRDDGRRSAAAYRDYQDAARRLTGKR